MWTLAECNLKTIEKHMQWEPRAGRRTQPIRCNPQLIATWSRAFLALETCICFEFSLVRFVYFFVIGQCNCFGLGFTSLNWKPLSIRFSFESNPQLLWFCFTTFYDWHKNLVPSAQPIRFKTKSNHNVVTRVFPRLAPITCILLRVLIGSFCLRSLWLANVIALILVLRHTTEMNTF